MEINDLFYTAKNFEGCSLTTTLCGEKLGWFVHEIEAIIGSGQDDRNLADKIIGDWSAEIIEGYDFVLFGGEENSAFKGSHRRVDDPTLTDATTMILFEPGLSIVVAKMNRPTGYRLRHFIIENVLPQIVQVEALLAKHQPVGKHNFGYDANIIRAERERRLARRLEFDERRFKVRTLQQTVESIKDEVSSEATASLRVVAAEIALGEDMSAFKPSVESDWLSPSEIAKRFGVSANRVGRAISALGLRGNIPGIAKAIMNKAQHSDRNVISYLYSPKAVQQIEKKLRIDGCFVSSQPASFN